MNQRDYKLSELVAIFDNAATDEECDTLLKWFLDNEDRHEDGMVHGSGDSRDGIPVSNQIIKNHKIARQIYPMPEDPVSDLMTQIIFGGLTKYSELYPIPNGQPLCARDYSIRVYHKGIGCFKEHADQIAGSLVTRVFAIIFYLNDVEEGGETEFPYLNIKVAPVKGRLLIFPCNYLFRHRGNIPISNDKFIITSFINFVDAKSS